LHLWNGSKLEIGVMLGCCHQDTNNLTSLKSYQLAFKGSKVRNWCYV